MGFRANAYATVWSIEEQKGGNTTKVRLSVNRKNKQTEQYEQDFSGFCMFIGPAHEAASKLKEQDRIKITECDVSTRYDKEKEKEYVSYKVFGFEFVEEKNNAPKKKTGGKNTAKKSALDEGDVDESGLPF